MKPLPQRKSPRLQGYDYASEGAYFVTICTYKRDLLFGDVFNGEMQLDPLGQLVHNVWLSIPDHKPGVSLDYFVVMPNHIHGIIVLDHSSIVENEGTSKETAARKRGLEKTAAIHHRPTSVDPTNTIKKAPTLGAIIGHFKAAVTRDARKSLNFSDRIWQTSYYDHIIRKEESLNYIRHYVLYNPAKWSADEFYNETH